jgi:peptide chain release factor
MALLSFGARRGNPSKDPAAPGRIAHMATLPSSDKEEALRARLESLGVRDEDLDESFVRSGGPGGQNVNKTSTCVVLHHRPTGIRVRCQETRSQSMNRFLARRRLADAIERKLRGEVAAEKAAAEKIRRQKRKRSKRAQAKVLADKAHHSAKKQARRTPTID